MNHQAEPCCIFPQTPASWKHPINVPIEDINIVDNPEIAEKYNVISLPTILLINDKDEVVETWHGIVKSEIINNKIKEYEAN